VKKFSKALLARIAEVRMVVLDVDGVLTDGRLYYGPNGEELKVFNTLDGHGIKMLADSGVDVAIISGRSSKALARRAKDLGIRHLMMGVSDKAAAYKTLLKKCSLVPEAVASIGDDIVDLPILLNCGFSAAVPAAPAEVLSRVDFVTMHSGGAGAVREFCETIMRAQNTFDAALNRYLADLE
jgi:3-deoxy-D-manno-octulosonate 8-phosphate phosphatase (KDO 8-P phosphatase)